MLRTVISLLIGGVLYSASVLAQPPDTLWTQTYGGEDWDDGYSVQQTSDEGYIVAGTTKPYGPGGEADVYLIKLDETGNEIWSQTLGGNSWDEARSVQQTSDGGYIIAGYSNSFGGGLLEIYLVKVDSLGIETWSHTYNGYGDDIGQSVQQTMDGGYILAGLTDPYQVMSYDVCLLKTDGQGNEIWSRTFGGNVSDMGYSVQQTTDGGYIIAGETNSYGAGLTDVYLIKTDSLGNEVWSRTFGGGAYDRGRSVQQTPDGGYIIAGSTSSFGAGNSDFYLIKTDGSGNEVWSQTYGGGSTDYANSVDLTSDGGFIIAGSTWSFGAGDYDAYLVRTDGSGNEVWLQTFGGSSGDYANSVQQTSDGGYISAGMAYSYGTTSWDVYLIRLEPETTYPNVTITIEPINPPIIIPATGGTFEYELTLENLTAQTQTVDIWIDVTLPNGTVYGPLALRQDFEMLPGFSLTRILSQYVPLPAPEGQYTMNAYVGDYDLNEVWCEDHFTFMKVCDGGESIDYLPEPEGFDLTVSERFTVYQPGEIEIDNHPNPFNPTTVLSYKLQVASFVNLSVYDVVGRQVADLVDGWREAGYHEVTFDGKGLTSGVYLYNLRAGESHANGKLVYMK